MRLKDFIVGDSAYLIYFDRNRKTPPSYVFEVLVSSVGSKYVNIEDDGRLIPLKYTKADKKDRYLSSVGSDNSISNKYMLFPNEEEANTFLDFIKLRNWFALCLNWSPFGTYAVDGMSFNQLKAIELIIKHPDIADAILELDEITEAIAG